MPSVPWRVLVTVPSLLAVALFFGWVFATTADNAALAIASLAVGGLVGYLGKLNGAKEKV